MRIDREKAFLLRQEGKSYRNIREELGVPMSTLSKWFSKEEWSKNLRQKLLSSGSEGRSIRIQKLNQVRGENLAKLYEKARTEARKELHWLRHDGLFVAGLMLYYADGDRTSKNYVRLSTLDLEKGKFYVEFLKKACGVPPEKIRASLMVYPGQDDQSNRRFWGFALGPDVAFTKSTVVKGRYDARQLRYGICTFTVSSTYLKVKFLEWLTLLPKQLMEGR